MRSWGIVVHDLPIMKGNLPHDMPRIDGNPPAAAQAQFDGKRASAAK
jgi:hypothetical protein